MYSTLYTLTDKTSDEESLKKKNQPFLYFQVKEVTMSPTWMDASPLQQQETLTANFTDFDRNDLTDANIGGCDGICMDIGPLGRETGTSSLVAWGVDKAVGTEAGVAKHLQDQGTEALDIVTVGTGTDTVTIETGIGINSGSFSQIQDKETGTGTFTGFLCPISESESESSLIGLRQPFKPSTFDDNLVTIIIVTFISTILTMMMSMILTTILITMSIRRSTSKKSGPWRRKSRSRRFLSLGKRVLSSAESICREGV